MHLIPSVLPSHSGTYSCVAENVLGQVTNHPTNDSDEYEGMQYSISIFAISRFTQYLNRQIAKLIVVDGDVGGFKVCLWFLAIFHSIP